MKRMSQIKTRMRVWQFVKCPVCFPAWGTNQTHEGFVGDSVKLSCNVYYQLQLAVFQFWRTRGNICKMNFTWRVTRCGDSSKIAWWLVQNFGINAIKKSSSSVVTPERGSPRLRMTLEFFVRVSGIMMRSYFMKGKKQKFGSTLSTVIDVCIACIISF
jgi:hypothetical protein